MKQKIFPLFLALLMLFSASIIPAHATLLSPAVSVLAKDAVLVKSGYMGQSVYFSQSDFKQALGTTDISLITIESLPDEKTGVLKLASSRVDKGQSISVAVLDLLKFIPADETVTEASFSFTAGKAAGGAEIACSIRLIDKKNQAPTVSEYSPLAVETQKGISYFGTLAASDPDGDELTYRIISYPKYGTVTLTDSKSGEYRYTPATRFTGKDSFTFVVRDEYGNYTTPTTVSIKVSPRNSTLVYADMKDHPALLASLVLTEKGLMMGRLSGDNLYFDPEETVSRGEFTVMAMKSAGISAIEGLTDTCFDDNEDISEEIRPYIATAQMLGFVNGSFDGTGLYFEPNRPITRAEASVILCHILGMEFPEEQPVFAPDESSPVWARPALSALSLSGALSKCEDGLWNANIPLSRADTARMLYTVIKK
ncbi:MAG: cadherin-like domain-containing protein [Clostridia bacterium]|nr:cadherin-like domain-containing protein [Clostridia bacterium]